MRVEEYFVKNKIEFKPESGGNELRIHCPFCDHPKNKLYVSSVSGAFYCFHCGMCGKFQFLSERLTKDTGITISAPLNNPSPLVEPTPIDPEIVEKNHQGLFANEELMSYLHLKRGYSDETIKHFKLGFDGRNLVIPIFNARLECINFKLRSDPTLPTSIKTTFNIRGRGTKRIFNEEVLRKKQERVIICEGEWDAMLLSQYGYAAVTGTTGAMGWNIEWCEAFGKCEKIYLCYDRDKNEAGQKGAEKTAKMFLEKGVKVYLIKLPQLFPSEEKLDITDFFIKRNRRKEDFTKLLKDAVEFNGIDFETPQYQIYDLDQIDKMEFPLQKWIVNHMIPMNAITAIGGFPGTMKSYWANYLAYCISDNIPVLGKFEVEPVPILFVDKENSLRRIQDRFRLLGLKNKKNIHYFNGNLMLDKKDDVGVICTIISQFDIKLVFIDTLIRTHSQNENDATEMNKIYLALKELLLRDVSICFLQHFNKFMGEGKPDIIRQLRGSGDIFAWLDSYFALDKKKHENIIALEFGKSRDEELPPTFLMEASFLDKSVDFKYLSEITEEGMTKQGAIADQILELLKSNIAGARFVINELSFMASERSIRQTLRDLEKMGKIYSMQNGHEKMYALKKQMELIREDPDL